MRVCACLAIVRATTTIAVLHVGKLTSVGISPELLYSLLQEEFIPYNTQSHTQTVSGSGSDTVAVGAQWFTSAKEDTDLIYKITKALWNKESRKLMDVGHAKGKTITPESALSGVGVPLHPGAEKFYKEAGLIN